MFNIKVHGPICNELPLTNDKSAEMKTKKAVFI